MLAGVDQPIADRGKISRHSRFLFIIGPDRPYERSDLHEVGTCANDEIKEHIWSCGLAVLQSFSEEEAELQVDEAVADALIKPGEEVIVVLGVQSCGKGEM